MIHAAIVGLGWWGKTLVESVHGSAVIRFVGGAMRTFSPELKAFADAPELRLADPTIDAGLLATPHALHAPQDELQVVCVTGPVLVLGQLQPLLDPVPACDHAR